ncbi:MAG: heme-copper oxidase subunit III [Deltaproteobacteria bacterium]|nr:heme-copper oxidase subunit III [Deltaproteobacteria bacterium]
MTTASATPPAPAEWTLPSRGRVGMACLILTESAFFAIFIAAHLFYIGKSLNPPYARDVLELPVLNTICLLSSSITITLALRALRRGAVGTFSWLWLATILLGLEFLIGTGLEWYGLIYRDGLTIDTNLLGTTFYSLVGFHAAHVTLGLLMLSGTLLFVVLGWAGERDVERIDVLSWYWHFVDAIWVVVLTVVYVIV